MGLVQLALVKGDREGAVPLLAEARQRFLDIGLPNWAEQAGQLLAQAQGRALTLDDLVTMVRAAREGDSQSGQQAWEICEGLKQAEDATLVKIGQGLQAVLAGVPPEAALAALPEEVRTRLLQVLG